MKSRANAAFSSISSGQLYRGDIARRFATHAAEVISTTVLSRLVIQAPERDWRPQVEKALEELIRLPVGWDGYRGQPVSFENANFAVTMLEKLCRNGTPAPQIVPIGDGSLQIEWHTENGDIELQVRRPNDVLAWRQTARTGPGGEEQNLTVNFLPIVEWVEAISEPAVDADADAAAA